MKPAKGPWRRLVRTALRGTVAAWLGSTPALARGEDMTDEAVRAAIVRESIAQYPSVCACPYSMMRNGAACGRRSAYSRPGGRSPLCYPQDVSPEMVGRWRRGR